MLKGSEGIFSKNYVCLGCYQSPVYTVAKVANGLFSRWHCSCELVVYWDKEKPFLKGD